MILRTLAIALAAFIVAASTAMSGSAASDLVTITLDDGSTLVGEIISETETEIVVDTQSVGRVSIARARIREMDSGAMPVPEPRDSPAPSRPSDPDYNSLLLVPTSETLKRGDSYYRNFEVLFNNVGLSITDYLNLSVMVAFPIESDFTIGSIGAKLRLLSLDRSQVGVALAGNVLIVDDQTIYTGTGIVSIGSRLSNLSIVMNVLQTDSDTVMFVLAGAGILIGDHWKFIVEYGNSTDAVLDDDDYNGLFNAGFRYFNRDVSLTLTGIRPLEVSGDFTAFPLVSVSFHF